MRTFFILFCLFFASSVFAVWCTRPTRLRAGSSGLLSQFCARCIHGALRHGFDGLTGY
jgi:hypothetical protein